MAKSAKNIKQGDFVVHAVRGVGKVMGVEDKEINGKTKKFYKVETNSFTYWIPVEKVRIDMIRKVSSPNTFQNMLSLIRKRPKKIAKKYQARTKMVSTALMDSSLKGKARMIRDLHGRQVRKDLSFDDQMALEKLKKNFIEEWVIASGLKKDAAVKKLDKALITSASKIPLEN